MAPSQRKLNSAMKKKLEEEKKKHLTFSTRKNGLFKKVTELSILCGAQTALIVTSKNGDGGEEIFACGYPTPDAVIRRFRRVGTGNAMSQKQEENVKLETCNAEYEAALERLEKLRGKLKAVKDEQQQRGSVFNSWWETPIDDMDLGFLEQFKDYLMNLKLNFVARQRYCEMIPLGSQSQRSESQSQIQMPPSMAPLSVKNSPPVWTECCQPSTSTAPLPPVLNEGYRSDLAGCRPLMAPPPVTDSPPFLTECWQPLPMADSLAPLPPTFDEFQQPLCMEMASVPPPPLVLDECYCPWQELLDGSGSW